MINKFVLALNVALFSLLPGLAAANTLPIAQSPLFAGSTIPPLVLLTMSNDHQLFFEAFPDYADLTGNGAAERTYNHAIDYYGYFDSFKCYSYSSANGRFVPAAETSNKYCDGVAGDWSGNFLNYVTMARIDVVRKILYGGYRSTDTAELTVLERTYLPNAAHSWVRFYDGDDIHRLTPFTLPQATTTTSTSNVMVPVGARNAAGSRVTLTTGWSNNSQRQIGDQVRIQSATNPAIFMVGVIRELPAANQINVQVTSSGSVGTSNNNWQITNASRRGVSFCNTTVASTQWSQNVTDPPLMRVASGNYSLWTANERWQCRWSNEKNRTGHSEMQIGGLSFSNGNAMSFTGLPANSDNPVRAQVGLGLGDYAVRVEACVSDALRGTEMCKRYPAGNLKPIGLLQEFGDDGSIRFGLLTGSYQRNKSGGVLRRNIGPMADEVNIDTDGTFRPLVPAVGSIIRTLNAFRLFGYDHNEGFFNNTSASGDNCIWGLSSFSDGRCRNWGNPQAEIFLEGLRYLAGLTPTTAFSVSGSDAIAGLPVISAWQDPISSTNWCANVNLINFNSSVSSYDGNNLGGAADLGMTGGVDQWTNTVGAGEGIHGNQFFVGRSGADNNQVCTAKSVATLSSVEGLCPEAPRLEGTYHIAGLAHFAYTNSIRSDIDTPTGQPVDVNVKTFGVSLAPAVPRIDIPRPGEVAPAVSILPACRNSSVGGNCAIVDFRIVEQDIAGGTGRFLIQWEDSEQGGDYDMDMNGVLSYQITNNNITVTTNVFSQSTPNSMGFGYVISGTTLDGFYAHSGINNFTRASGTAVPGCNNCRFDDNPTSYTFTLGSSNARPLEEPMFYAAKWGGYDTSRNFPSDPLSWDTTGDGTPDNYFFAVDPAQLFSSLRNAFQQVLDAVETTTLETTSSRLETGTLVYQAGFDTRDWSGEVNAIDPFAPPAQRIRWSASETVETLPWAQRNIFTNIGGQGYNFAPTMPESIRDTLFAGVEQLRGSADCQGLDSQLWFCQVDEQQLINFLRGDRSNGLELGGFLRDRQSLVGDVVNSQIVLSPMQGRANEGWSSVDIDYAAFVDAKLTRIEEDKATVFVGSNNGMLHAFDADTGTERFAFIPSAVVPNLHRLADPSYQHRFFVDGRLAVADAFIPGRGWRTVLVGALGAGGKSLFALDVTSPESFNPDTDVLWELTPSTPGAENLGHIMGLPQITRLSNGTFVAIVGNGYNAANNAPTLMVIDLSNGQVLQNYSPTIPAGELPEHNGLSAPTIVLDDATREFVSRVYAGDLTGRMWRFDFSGSTVNSDHELFRARVGAGATAQDQGITGAPNVTTSVEGGLNVYFGTGRFFVEGDELLVTPVQSFYKIRDLDSGTTLTRSDLGEARITQESAGVRSVTVQSFGEGGWYMDLIGPGGADPGERVLVRPEIIAGRVIFSTFQPSNDPCEGGGVPRLYVLDAGSGAGALGIPGLGPEGGGGVQITGVGSPLNPPVVITPPPPQNPGDFENPIPPGIGDDGLPIAPPIPPSGDGLDRSSWCSRVGYLNPVDQQFVPLAALCDGRQVWRQIW